ncbi:MAG: PSK operon transcription factor [Acidobacteria bacterium]|nr:MAG: PSK operon transcription factor [Acidobacteriota bacterium]
MPLSINDPQAEALVKQLTEKTGETSEQVILRSLRERLDRVGNGHTESLAEELDQIGKRCAALPDVDKRSPDEILGYDENGLPT